MMAESNRKREGSARGWSPSRRELLGLGGALAVGGGIAGAARWWNRHEKGLRASVFIGKASDYQADLAAVVGQGLRELGITNRHISGKRILLKPNLVETAPSQAPINTHPSVVVAAADAFRRLGAADVIVAEGQGHRRDSWLVLEESGMSEALADAGLSFVDLNHDEVVGVENAGSWTDLRPLYLPKTLLAADWVVSLAKLKTHHWAGVTCAMKNLFGVMPGVVYGWPKNPLHHAGIAASILDINTTVRPALAVVDGIVGMEGDGPIMGSPKRVGCMIMGRNLAAVDATCVRLMDLNPYGVKYLASASGRLGPIHEWNIAQRGESIATMRTRFDLVDVPHLAGIRGG
ncbi:MAG: DUF362 domain-containing protein [Phycisphaerae bacterium]